MVQSFNLCILFINRVAGNSISLSRRTTLVLSLKSLLDGLCGPEDQTAMNVNVLLAAYSGNFFLFEKGQSHDIRLSLRYFIDTNN